MSKEKKTPKHKSGRAPVTSSIYEYIQKNIELIEAVYPITSSQRRDIQTILNVSASFGPTLHDNGLQGWVSELVSEVIGYSWRYTRGLETAVDNDIRIQLAIKDTEQQIRAVGGATSNDPDHDARDDALARIKNALDAEINELHQMGYHD